MKNSLNTVAFLAVVFSLGFVCGCDSGTSTSNGGAVPPGTEQSRQPPGELEVVTEPPHGLPRLGWQVPADWQQVEARSNIVVAEFQAPTPSGVVRVTFISLPEEGSDPLANINRWCDQISLAHYETLALAPTQPLAMCGSEGTFVDLLNETNGQRIMAATSVFGGRGWFVKMTGNSDQLAYVQEDFKAFTASLHILPPHE